MGHLGDGEEQAALEVVGKVPDQLVAEVGVLEGGVEVEVEVPSTQKSEKRVGRTARGQGDAEVQRGEEVGRQGGDDPWTGEVLADVWVSKLVSLNPFSAGRVVMVIARAEMLEPYIYMELYGTQSLHGDGERRPPAGQAKQSLRGRMLQ